MTSLHRHDEQAPACAWAEETILSWVLHDPSLMGRCADIGPELQFPEFGAIWQGMVRARMRQPNPTAANWWSAVHNELERMECRGIHDDDWRMAYRAECAKGLDSTNPLSSWWTCRANKLLRLIGQARCAELFTEEFDYALFRLHCCTEARRMVSRAVDIANRAWRVPEVPYEPVTQRVRQRLPSASRVDQPALAARTSPPTVWDMDEL